jgi:hypothetical protein
MLWQAAQKLKVTSVAGGIAIALGKGLMRCVVSG